MGTSLFLHFSPFSQALDSHSLLSLDFGNFKANSVLYLGGFNRESARPSSLQSQKGGTSPHFHPAQPHYNHNQASKMSAKNVSGSNGKKPASAATNLIAGGAAGMMEALVCHPLDTIKVRMQLSRRARAPGAKKRGFVTTGVEIVKRETPLGLYKGLGAVVTGIVPKMAIRFTSFEAYKKLLADKETGNVTGKATFLAGLAAGVTEAVAVVTPMEVIKIRLQAQHHSMADPLDIPKYRNAAHALYTVIKEEGVGALYRGVSLTALRQGTNQAANFTAYSYLRSALQDYQGTTDLPG